MKNNRGQVVIILLLVMVVGLTVGLSVVSRSLLNVKQSTQTEESSRAFTAAEAGIEVALEGMENDEFSGEVGDSQYSCTRTEQGESENYIFYNLEKDKVAQLYFTSASAVETRLPEPYVSSIRVLWGKNPDIGSVTPAMEVSLIYKNIPNSAYRLAKFALDPNSTRGNNFCSTCVATGKESIDTSEGPVDFYFGANIDVSSFNSGNNFLIFGRFRLLYNKDPSHLGIKATGGNLPSQGSVIDCLGTVEKAGVSRRIKVFENYPAVPEVFDYVLFNGNPSQSLGH